MYINERFMLHSNAAVELYEGYAKSQPIFDFHNHLDPSAVAENRVPRSITELWLGGDHYKWRAMRAAGVGEEYITGKADDFEKFSRFAATIPQTIGGPLYHWAHLELKRYFGIDTLLNAGSACEIFDHCNQQIAQGGFGALDLLHKMNVAAICTTDDPTDTLEHHGVYGGIEVRPTWRPDRAVHINQGDAWREYIQKLGAPDSFAAMIEALRVKQLHFIAQGCLASDHGIETLYAEAYTEAQIEGIYQKALRGDLLSLLDVAQYKSAAMFELAKLNAGAGWVQQFHVGPLRNNCSRLFDQLGPDVGCDSLGDRPLAEGLNRFLDRLDTQGALAKTIAYNLNPKDTEVIVSALGNFNDGSVRGKMQYGSAWWFLDQADGMHKQLTALASIGLLGPFVGMVTDSRSFMSFTRHDYFRRLLCNWLGEQIESGLLPSVQTVGPIVEGICYTNAKNYFAR